MGTLMRILYVGMKYDYGRPEQGLSFEHNNFYHSLVSMGHDIVYFDFMTLLQKHGREWLNKQLLEVVKSEKPELLFSVLFTDQFNYETFRTISNKHDTITLNWFTDDHWRFESFSRHWAPCFHWVITTSKAALPKYQAVGCMNVIKSQWACNHFMYKPTGVSPVHDVTFVGQPHGNRRSIVEWLLKQGIKVKAWGNGWGEGRLSQDDMIRVFGQSRINLNLSNASVSNNSGRSVAPIGRLLRRVPGVSPFRRSYRAVSSFLSRGAVCHDGYPDQIKGRNFEVPGCGGFLLTPIVEDLGEYYKPGSEIGVFGTLQDLADRIRYYLENEDERIRVAAAGLRRTLHEHTYAHRFSAIFEQIGLSSPSPADLLTHSPTIGVTEEIW